MHKFDPRSYVLCFCYLNEIHTDKGFNSEYGFSCCLLLQEIFPSSLSRTSRTTYLFIPVLLVVMYEASRLYEACHV